ncbi:MAG: lysophospholipid acyltransferase family protein [Bacteroidota bacterium]|jgi:KDO2-lipid IV(A) lauroyltransferase
MKHYFEFAIFQVFRWCVLLLPLKSAQRLGGYLGSLAFHLYTPRKNIALENLRHAFPDKTEEELRKIAQGAFRNYGIALVELLWFPNLDDKALRRLVEIENLELMKAAYARGKGLIMLSGHFGNWELIALAMGYLSKLPITIIVQTQANKLVDDVINRNRCLLGNRVVPMGMSVREIIRTLDEGGVVAIAPDQSGAMEGAFVNFFGRSVATHKGPAVFALRSGAPVQMGFITRKPGGRYTVVLEEIPTGDLTDNTEESVVELTRRHTALLEKYVRMHPDHWLWMHRRWKHTQEQVEQLEQSSARASI